MASKPGWLSFGLVIALLDSTAWAHPIGGAAHARGTIGGTSPAVRLPKLDPLPKARGAAPRVLQIASGVQSYPSKKKTAVAAPADEGSTSITAQGNFGTQIANSGDGTYTITGGTAASNGADLLHSFGSFNLLNGDTADFVAGPNVKTIVARITGGPSTIDGTLTATANLFLINPAGVMFTGNSALNLSGSFAVTTASAVRLKDGLQINASISSPLSVQTSSPAGFIFNFASAGTVSFSDTFLSLNSGTLITAVAGSISIDSVELEAPAGRINLIATASAGTVQLDPFDLASDVDVSSFSKLGAVTIADGSQIVTDGDGGGRICVRGDSLTLTDSSSLSAITGGSGTGIGIDVVMTGDLTITDSSIITGTTDVGRGGNILLSAGTISVTGLDNTGFGISAMTSTGPGGSITLTGGDISLLDGAEATTVSNDTGTAGNITCTGNSLSILRGGGGLFAISNGSGSGGNITVTIAKAISIDGANAQGGATGIYAETNSTASGAPAAGNVTISAGTLTITNGGDIDTNTNGTGAGGTLSLTVAGLTTLNDNDGDGTTAILAQSDMSDPGGGPGGQVNLQTGSLSILNGAQIDSSTFGTGAGGSITVNVQGHATLQGDTDATFTGVSAESDLTDPGGGKGGHVVFNAASLTVLDSAEIESSTQGTGIAGNVTVDVTGLLTLDGGGTAGLTYIGSGSFFADAPGAGPAGDVTVTAGSLQILRGARFTGVVEGTGNGGSISVNVAGDVLLDDTGNNSEYLTGITTSSEYSSAGAGAAGSITLTAANLTVRHGAEIVADADGVGNGGSVTVNVAGNVTVDGASSGVLTGITAGTRMSHPGGGKGGDVNLTAGSLSILNDAEVSADTFGTGAGGKVTANVSGPVTLDGVASTFFTGISTDSENTNPHGGAAGTVTLNAGSLSIVRGAELDSSTLGTG
jgi:filamentous hemagglutinin family protein